MRYDDSLVGGVAIIVSIIAIAIAIGPWQRPYQLRSIDAVRVRFGMVAARIVWAIVATACFVAGASILAGVRPSYAAPVGKALPQQRSNLKPASPA